MVKFRRGLQILNRVALPPEIVTELGWKVNTPLEIELKDKKIIIQEVKK